MSQNAIADTYHKRLRVVLMSLVDDPRRIHILAADIGLTAARIDFTESAELVWFEVIDEADKQGRLDDLVASVAQDYPEHEDIKKLQAELTRASAPRLSPSAAGSIVEVPESLEEDAYGE